MRIYGRTGLNRFSGQIYEELHPKLRGTLGVKVYQEMRDNDPIIGAILFLIRMLIRQSKWAVEPAGNTQEDKANALFLKQCQEDMSGTWEDFVSEILSMLVFGWSYFEIIYKRRGGDVRDPIRRSRFSDGRIAWRKIEIRAQETLDRWEFDDDDGGILGMWQYPPPDYQLRYVPIEKALLFRTETTKNNPEGRALTLDTPVPTPNGWTTMGAISLGDRVYDEYGRVRYVVGKSQVWENRPVYEITFSAQTTVVADENHLWSVKTANDRHGDKPSRILTTKELFEWQNRPENKHKPGFCVGLCPVLDGVEMALPIDPYVLGYWLGDGTHSSGAIAVSMDDFVSLKEQVEAAGFSINHDGDRMARVFDLKNRLRAAGILYNKHIPAPYLRASVEQRLALLQGLMDSDGTSNTGKDQASFWYNSNEQLVRQFAELVATLGGRPRVRVHCEPGKVCGTINGKPIIQKKRLYSVGFYLDRPVHRLQRKHENQQMKHSCRVHGHLIKDIRYVGKASTVCIEVDSPSHLFIVGRGMVPTHNSILRNAFTSYRYLKGIREFEAIGIERELAGLPVLEVPPHILLTDASSADQSLLAELKTFISEVRRDEREGLIIPAESYSDSDGKEIKTGYKFRLASAGGSRQIDPDKVIRRYEQRIAMTTLAEFILLGMDKVGSFALASTKTNLFAVSLGALLDMMASVVNRYAVPRLFALNAMSLERLPKFVPGDIENIPLEEIGNFLSNLTKVGIIIPDEALQREVRRLAKLPPPDEDGLDEPQQRPIREESDVDPGGGESSGGA